MDCMFVLTEYILLGALGFGCVLGPMVCEREAIQPYLGPLWNTGNFSRILRFFCVFELIPMKILYNSCEKTAFQRRPK